MTGSDQTPLPTPADSIPDLAQSDARAFMATNDIKSAGSVAPQPSANGANSAASDSIVRAMTEAKSVREASTKSRSHILIYIGVAAVVALAVVVYVTTGHAIPKNQSTNSSSPGVLNGLPSTSNDATSKGLSGQIKQDVKTCSNDVNAALEC